MRWMMCTLHGRRRCRHHHRRFHIERAWCESAKKQRPFIVRGILVRLGVLLQETVIMSFAPLAMFNVGIFTAFALFLSL